MYQYIYEESVRRAKHKIWILSDLQQKDPERARECLDISMTDYESMGAPADMIWYLGDSIEGTNREHLTQMCQMQEQAFERTGLPLCYVMGNHELDYSRAKEHEQEPVFLPFYEMVKRHEGWHTTPAYTDPYFKVGDYAWAKENAYRRISCVDWHDIPQINVSSFEHIRGKFCRSVFLHIYEDHSFGIFFRNHNARKFSEVYFPAKEKQMRGGNFDGL